MKQDDQSTQQSPDAAERPALNSAASSSADARTARRARTDGRQSEAEQGVQGAVPSNTAPYNCNTGETCTGRLLRWGVDSLYLSYPGDLTPEANTLLKELKTLAQSNQPDDVVRAQIKLLDHVFEVKEKGTSLFSYIIEDGAFRIQLSCPGRKAPMAYVKVSSKYLAHVGPDAAEKQLRAILAQLGTLEEEANVSRIDLFVDFESGMDMEHWGRESWVTRASSITAYADSGQFTGWAIGMGGVMSARLYFKLLEIVKSGKEWIIPLWQQAHWDGITPVWRLEFEIKREVLTQKGLSKFSQVMHHLSGLWSYATTEWLRLTLPSAEDATRSRWPIHPLWVALASVDWEQDGGPLGKRFSPTRSPVDDKLFELGVSAILSFMAKHGFKGEEFYEGAEDFLASAYDYFESKAYQLGLSFDDLIVEKLAIKHRLYNTLLNDPDFAVKLRERSTSEAERHYRKASDGV